ncbi:MAG: TonB-dependent receptor [Deltaproteobacteria bacterium]|nr:TonB-dependent receptor [Deltaproteobacteria bacterium]
MESLTISLGVAYDQITFDLVEGDFDVDPQSAVGPRGAIVIRPFDGGQVHISGAQKARFTTPAELFDPAPTAAPELDPEQSAEGEIGFHHTFGETFGYELTGFYQSTTDVVRGPYDPVNRDFGRAVNAGNETNLGGTVRVTANPMEGLYTRADYTYLSVRFDSEDRTLFPEDVFWTPAHRANFLIGGRLPGGFGANIGASYSSETADPESEDREDLSAFGLLHAKAYYNYRNFMEIWAGANNILDVYYETARDYPMPGRFIHGGLSLMF